MRKPRFRSYLLFLTIFSFLPSAVYGLENASFEPETIEYDGFLIAMADESMPDEFPFEFVAPDVYYTDDEDAAHELLQKGYAEYVEPNYAVSLFSSEDDVNWAYDLVGGPDAKLLGLGGEGVKIAIIDSGVDVNNMNLRGAKIVEGYDYLEHTPEQTDTVGHGTYVSQILAGSGDLGVAGIARDAELIPLRCFSATKGNISDIIAAIYDAIDVYHCDIINMSWGMTESSAFLEDALKKAYSEGIILVAAAGNVSKTVAQGTLYYPAAYPEVIGVGAVKKTSVVSSTSQQTEAVFVCAPGEGIEMASLSGVLGAQNGTSFSAPYVTAELALLKQLDSSLDAESAFSLLRDRSVDLGKEGYDVSYGYGFAEINGLLGQSWCQVEKSETELKLTGWLRNADGGRVISTLYEESGKMLDCAFTGFETSISGFEFTYGAEAAEIKLFFADPYFTPLTEHVVISLQEEQEE